MRFYATPAPQKTYHACAAAEASRFNSLLSSEGLEVYEPPGQDGRRCQYLAVADQLERRRCLPFHAYDFDMLEGRLIEWLKRHKDDVTIGFTRGDEADIERVSDKWSDAEFASVMARAAWGSHQTLGALCSMLGERHGMCVAIKVRHLSGRIDLVGELNRADQRADVATRVSMRYSRTTRLAV